MRGAFAAALLMAAPSFDQRPISPLPDNPTTADKAVLLRAIRECQLHPGSLYFIQRAIPREPVIKMTRALGDTEQQLQCAYRHFPADFSTRFGLEFEHATKR